MNKRLEAIRRLIPDGRGMIDVGTDHGYLPVQLYKDGYPGRIFASDIRPSPLAAARERAGREGASERICFFLCRIDLFFMILRSIFSRIIRIDTRS